MRRIQTVIHSLGLDALGTPVVRLRTPEAWAVAPGQAILADFLGASGLLTPVFPCEIQRGLLALPVDASGCPAPGARLDLFGPVGVGFQPPAAARRWLLSSTEASPQRLLPLLTQGMRLGAEIVYAGPQPVEGLAPSIEVVPDLAHASAWADYLAIDTCRQALPATLAWLAAADVHPEALSAEILVASEMLCGWGGCGACAVHGQRGWYLACVEGPVRPLISLLEGRGRRGA